MKRFKTIGLNGSFGGIIDLLMGPQKMGNVWKLESGDFHITKEKTHVTSS